MNNDILRFNVSMNHSLKVQLVNSLTDLLDDRRYFFFSQWLALSQVMKELSP